MKTRPNLGLAIVGGFVGTPAMTVGVYLIATLVHVKMNIVDTLATMLGGWKMGMLVHVLNGAIVFPLAYAVVFYRFLLGPSYVKGLTFGLTLWLASQLVVLPMIGAGVFSSHMDGVRAAGTLLFGHLIYGVLLGCWLEVLSRGRPWLNRGQSKRLSQFRGGRDTHTLAVFKAMGKSRPAQFLLQLNDFDYPCEISDVATKFEPRL